MIASDARAAAMEIINLVKHRQDWSIYWNYERFRIVNLDFQYYSLIHQAFMELIKFTKVYNTGLLIAMY